MRAGRLPFFIIIYLIISLMIAYLLIINLPVSYQEMVHTKKNK